MGRWEKSEQSAASAASSVWVGARVELCGLTRAVSLNGRIGICTDVDDTTARLMVLLTDHADEDGKSVKVKQANVRPAGAATVRRAGSTVTLTHVQMRPIAVQYVVLEATLPAETFDI